MEEMIVFIADNKKNKLMKAFDLCPDYKVFIEQPVNVKFTRAGTDSDEVFISKVINKSKISDTIEWIPAVIYKGLFYVAEGIREISDGVNSYVFHPGIGCVVVPKDGNNLEPNKEK